ncbi:hypothetical protein ACA910_012380 [Epithemia clementina (nom. ined.)]
MVYYNDDRNIDNGDNNKNKNNNNNNNNNVESAISSSSDISTSTVIASTRPEERFEQQGLPTTTTTTPKKKIVYGIRHAQSKSNEYMNQPGHDWGEPLFCDDLAFVDSPLSTVGLAQAESLQQQLLFLLSLSSLDGHQNAPNDDNKDNDNKDIKNYNWLSNVELVVVSPLTRCLQTLEYGCFQALQKICTNRPMPPMVALPLASERVYSAADIGRPWPVLRDEFPWVDWSWFQPPALAQEPEREPTYYHPRNNHHPNNNDDEKNPAAWWYTPNNDVNNDDDEYQEWRPPLGLGHWYAVPGEPEGAFQRRIQQLRTWIRQRPEQIILLVTHWGVLNALDNDGTLNPDNVQVCRLELDDGDNDGNNNNDNDDDLAAESQGA